MLLPPEGAGALSSFVGAYGPVLLMFFIFLYSLKMVGFFRIGPYYQLRLDNACDYCYGWTKRVCRRAKMHAMSIFLVFIVMALDYSLGVCFFTVAILWKKRSLFFSEMASIDLEFGVSQFLQSSEKLYKKLLSMNRVRDDCHFFLPALFDWGNIDVVVVIGSDGAVEFDLLNHFVTLGLKRCLIQIFSSDLRPLSIIGKCSNFVRYVHNITFSDFMPFESKGKKVALLRPFYLGGLNCDYPEKIDVLVVKGALSEEKKIVVENILLWNPHCQFQIEFHPLDISDVRWIRKISLERGGKLCGNALACKNLTMHLVSNDERPGDLEFSQDILSFLSVVFYELENIRRSWIDSMTPQSLVLNSLSPSLLSLKSKDVYVFGKLCKYKVFSFNIKDNWRRTIIWGYPPHQREYQIGFSPFDMIPRGSF